MSAEAAEKNIPSCRKDGIGPAPALSVKLPNWSELPENCKPWSHDHLPVDILLFTVEDCEFLACYAHMKSSFKSYHRKLGDVYFGRPREDENNPLKIALLRCPEGSHAIITHNVFHTAASELRPKAIYSVGCCIGLNPGTTQLGDVVISSKLTTLSYRTPMGRIIGKVIDRAVDGWEEPLESLEARKVHVHNGEVFSGMDKDSFEQYKELFPKALAFETEGEDLFVAAHDLGIEWLIVKGISDFDGNSITPDKSWKLFACVMAASVVFKMLTDHVIFREWPRDQDNLTPVYVRARGKKAIAAYRRAMKSGRTCDKRVKVLLVGQDRAGKTSLGKSLRGEPFDQYERSTDGVKMIPPIQNAGTEAWRNRSSPQHKTVFVDHKITTKVASELHLPLTKGEANNVPVINEAEDPAREADSVEGVAQPPETQQQEASSRHQKQGRESQKASLSAESVEEEKVDEMAPDFVAQAEQLNDKQIDKDDKIWPVIWDFAGQDIYRAIHPIFMSPEDIYLLVFDLTKNPSDRAECRVNLGQKEYTMPARDSEDTNLDHMLRWMDLIHSLKTCDESEVLANEFSLPPVIVVGTHADCIDPGKEIELVQEKCEGLLVHEGFVEHIFASLPIDNTKAGKLTNQEKIESLRDKILELADKMPHTKKEIPLRWHRVEKEISLPDWQEQKYLQKKDFRDNIASKFCKFDHEDDFEELLHFLHARGSIVYHEHAGDEDGLVVMDPQWLIDVLCEIVKMKPRDDEAVAVKRDRKMLQQKGILSGRLMDYACRIKKLDPIRDSLFSLMEKFNLICKWPAAKSEGSLTLVPCMLTTTGREGNAENKVTSNGLAPVYLTFKGTNYVPAGLFCQLVVLFGKWLSDPQHTHKYRLHANNARFALDEHHSLVLVCYKTVIKLHISSSVDSIQTHHCVNVYCHLKEFLETLRREFRWLHSMSAEVCARCTICVGKGDSNTEPCIRHGDNACEHHDCAHYIPLHTTLCCNSMPDRQRALPKKPLQPWIKAMKKLQPTRNPGTLRQSQRSGVKRKRKLSFSRTSVSKARKLAVSGTSAKNRLSVVKRRDEARKREERKAAVLELESSDDDLEWLSLRLVDSWDKLARRLEFKKAEITGVHKTNEKYDEKALSMLLRWKEKKGPNATNKVLHDALCHEFVQRNRLAEEFCSYLVTLRK